MLPDIEELSQRLRSFADARDWREFHTPKNLSMALAAEAGELLAEFQWLTAEESEPRNLSPEQRRAIADEMSDVLFYWLLLADRLGIDLAEASERKLKSNSQRYGVETTRGSARKQP